MPRQDTKVGTELRALAAAHVAVMDAHRSALQLQALAVNLWQCRRCGCQYRVASDPTGEHVPAKLWCRCPGKAGKRHCGGSLRIAETRQ